MFAATASFDTIIAELPNAADILYAQLVTTAGVHRVHPGLAVPEQYDPLQEAWLVKTASNNATSHGRYNLAWLHYL